ncbi:MAG: class I SAM-dependent methyltransferase [Anaerolineaceae bacterium]|jgi:23S rRNA (cytosine1962-C5)-methyltransferase
MSSQIKLSAPVLNILSSSGWKDYALLDSGNGWRLEHWGPYRLVRPEPEAIWHPALDEKEWHAADATFQPSPEENGGHWVFHHDIPTRWKLSYKDLSFWVQLSNSRHVGVFPEQAAQWDWMSDQIRAAKRPLQVLNLFGYTGLATLAAAKVGARVTHLDASRKAVTWAHENQQLSDMEDKPIRWIVDDALKFVQRESRRNAQYDGLILDPPKFGRGPKGEVWEFYKLLPNLLAACRQALGKHPIFVILTAYAVKASSITLYTGMQEMMSGLDGTITAGEIVLPEKSAGRLLSTAIFAHWSSRV